MKTYRHKPNLGDILYSIPLIQNQGGGILYLDPLGLPEYLDHYTRLFKDSLSFIRKQRGIVWADLYDGSDIDLELDQYVNDPIFASRQRCDLVAAHYRGCGFPVPPDHYKPWLISDPFDSLPVVVHRTPRYQSGLSWEWIKKLDCPVYCVGFESEVKEFQSWGFNYIKTNTLEDLASVVASAKIVVSGQSVVTALAVGLGKVRIVDYCPWISSNHFPDLNHYIMGEQDDFQIVKNHI